MHPNYTERPKKNIDDSSILVTEHLDIWETPAATSQRICIESLLKAILNGWLMSFMAI